MAIRLGGNPGADDLSRTTFLPSPQAVTICGWVRPSAFNTWNAIFELHTDTANYIQIFTNSTGGLLVEHAGAASAEIRDLNVDTWYFVAMVGTSAGVRGYASLETGPLSTQISTSFTNFTPIALLIGDNVWVGGEAFTGGCAAVKVWDTALTDREIAAERYSPVPVRKRNLNSWYPFVNQATALIDVSGQGRTLTRGGTQTTEADPPYLIQPSRARIARHEDIEAGGTVMLEAMAYLPPRRRHDSNILY